MVVPFVWHRPYRCNFVGREIRTAPVCWSRAGLLVPRPQPSARGREPGQLRQLRLPIGTTSVSGS